MGCSCNKSANRTSTVAPKRQIAKPRANKTIYRNVANKNINVVRRILDRY